MDTFSIWADDLTKTYPGGGKKGREPVVAVDHIHLQVAQGEFYGFLGPNGAGKSTTIKMLTGLLRPTSGRIVIAGHDISGDSLAVKRVIGVLPEDLNLYERLTAPEFLIFAGQMYGLSVNDARHRAEELLQLMELTDAGDKMIVDFSMGMKKKTALAGAMIHAPKVLFLDEPFNGIDALSARAIRDVLRRMIEHGTTIFFSSHVMEVVEKLCTRLAIIAKGRIVGEGTLDDLRGQIENPEATLEDIFVRLVSSPIPEGMVGQVPLNELDWLSA
ncbi:MAG TPA: ABC transporter ATP-binding protein [Capsulimonadaceae bacterium]|nr:ABC transporter ATP-binding protein [Capsulimonadaceae bacterium]